MQNYTFVSKLDEDASQLDSINPFFRTEELSTVLGVLEKGQNVWITGDFGSGKTTLLLLIEKNLLSQKVRVHKINMGIIKDEAEFFDSLSTFLKIKKKQRTPADIIRGLEKQRLVLLVDEFSVIEHSPSFSETFSTELRHIVNNSKLQLVITSQKMIDQNKFRGSPLTNIFVNISLPPFTADVAVSILKNIAANANVVLDEGSLQKAVEIANGSPRTIYYIGSLMAANNMDLGKVLRDFDLNKDFAQVNSGVDATGLTPSEIISNSRYG